MLIHDLDKPGMPGPLHQFGRVEFGCYQQGPSLVRH